MCGGNGQTFAVVGCVRKMAIKFCRYGEHESSEYFFFHCSCGLLLFLLFLLFWGWHIIIFVMFLHKLNMA